MAADSLARWYLSYQASESAWLFNKFRYSKRRCRIGGSQESRSEGAATGASEFI